MCQTGSKRLSRINWKQVWRFSHQFLSRKKCINFFLGKNPGTVWATNRDSNEGGFFLSLYVVRQRSGVQVGSGGWPRVSVTMT